MIVPRAQPGRGRGHRRGGCFRNRRRRSACGNHDPRSDRQPAAVRPHPDHDRRRHLRKARSSSPAGRGGPTGFSVGLYARPTIFSERASRHAHRAGGDLRPGAVDHPLRHGGGGGRDRQRHCLRPRRACAGHGHGRRRGTSPRGSASGQVHLNYPAWDPNAPFGGYKRSGNGREYGLEGMEEYLETKAVLGFYR